MKRSKVIAIIIWVALMTILVIAAQRNEMPMRKLDAIITVDAKSRRVRFIDDEGTVLGSVTLDESVVIELKRWKGSK